jgi:hypothetical protein
MSTDLLSLAGNLVNVLSLAENVVFALSYLFIVSFSLGALCRLTVMVIFIMYSKYMVFLIWILHSSLTVKNVNK